MIKKKLPLLFFGILIIFFNAGCAPKIENVKVAKDVKSATSTSQQELIERFKLYWHYFSKNDWENTHAFELPYQQFFFPLDRYTNYFSTAKKDFNIILLSNKIKNENIQYLKVEFVKDNLKYQFEDKWVNINGVWYHKFHSSTFPASSY